MLQRTRHGGLPALLTALACLSAGCDRPDHIEIDPRRPRLTHKGETVRLHGRLLDRGGKQFATERPAWSSRDPFVAAVDKEGLVAALSSGQTVVTARWNELTAQVRVEVDLVEALRVTPARVELTVSGEPVKVEVVALGLEGRPQPDRVIHLTSDSPAVARVDPEGKVWGLAPGEAVLRARLDDKEAEVRVVVK
jgi:hypothetical protein